MTNFKERPNPSTTVKVVQQFVPKVGITSEALAKMFIYVDECSDEIGWLGTVFHNEKDNTYLIEDVYLFDQDVHGATTEITPDGLSDFAEELLSMGEEGIEIWNNLRMWGHSHVRMGVTPSGQDDSQMKTFKEGGHEWFIRLIANKNGDMKIDLYDYKTGIVYLDLPWVEIVTNEVRAIQLEIDRLYEALDALETQVVDTYKEPIKEEMKTKVRKMHTTNNASKYGYYKDGKWVSYANEEKKTNGGKVTDSTKTTTHSGATTEDNEKVDRKGYYTEEDEFANDDEVRDYFTNMELIELAECKTFKELHEELSLYGYYNYFTDNDVERIFRVARKVETTYNWKDVY